MTGSLRQVGEPKTASQPRLNDNQLPTRHQATSRRQFALL